jgi:hypothetical protein
LTHVAVPLDVVGHLWLHEPQWLRLVLVLTSQPFDAVLSQLANPALQLSTVQTPAWHEAVAFVSVQGELSAFAGLEHMPLPGLHVPMSWH